MNTKEATIIFASPKVGRTADSKIRKYIPALTKLLNESGFSFKIEVHTNDDFKTTVLNKVLEVSGDIADTSELFLRSYQLYELFKYTKK